MGLEYDMWCVWFSQQPAQMLKSEERRSLVELRALVVVSERARKEAAGCKPPCAESDTEQPCACTSCHHSSLVRVRVTDAPGHIYSKFSSKEKETPPRNFPPRAAKG